MTDEQEKLRATIDELHTELSSLDHVDDNVQQMLKGTLDDIQGVLGDQHTDDSSTIVGRLNEAARHYEESHPTLCGIIGSIIDTLGRIGI